MHRLNGGELPGSLFHYTNQAGFEGILKSGCIWVSDIKHLNDAAELRYATSVMRAHIDRFRALEWDDRIRPLFDQLQRTIARQEFGDVFIMSLVADGDQKHLWNLYSDRGKGFSLTFSTLVPFEWKENWVLLKCNYGDEALTEFCQQILGVLRAIYERDLAEGNPAELPEYVDLFVENVRWFAPAFKLKAWADEAEWRLIRYGSGDTLQTRPDGRTYVKAPSNGRLQIAAAACGPNCAPDDAARACKTALSSGYGDFNLYHSQFATLQQRELVDNAVRNAMAEFAAESAASNQGKA